MNHQIAYSFKLLKSVIESSPLKSRFKGYDPFDGLNSPIIKNTFLGNSRIIRLAWVQLFKRNPINFRSLAGIKKIENPQALAVFLSSYCQLYKNDGLAKHLESIHYLANRIIELKLTKWSGSCWSYPFAWQARAFYQPKNTPLIIPTNYCFNALLDAHEITQNNEYKTVALSVAEFIIHDLNKTKEGDFFAFSYSPGDKSVVYNASLMASQVMSRCYHYTTDKSYKDIAFASVQYCVNYQKDDGSWTYGKKSFHQWIDNFHSGYNLVCLMDYATYCDDHQFDENIKKGLNYYLNTFFNSDGFSKYFNTKKYPLDINNVAQLVITLNKAKKLTENQVLISSVLNYTITTLQSKKGWFYYQKNKWTTNKNIYLRWSNAWMFYAYSLLSKNADS